MTVAVLCLTYPDSASSNDLLIVVNDKWYLCMWPAHAIITVMAYVKAVALCVYNLQYSGWEIQYGCVQWPMSYVCVLATRGLPAYQRRLSAWRRLGVKINGRGSLRPVSMAAYGIGYGSCRKYGVSSCRRGANLSVPRVKPGWREMASDKKKLVMAASIIMHHQL